MPQTWQTLPPLPRKAMLYDSMAVFRDAKDGMRFPPAAVYQGLQAYLLPKSLWQEVWILQSKRFVSAMDRSFVPRLLSKAGRSCFVSCGLLSKPHSKWGQQVTQQREMQPPTLTKQLEMQPSMKQLEMQPVTKQREMQPPMKQLEMQPPILTKQQVMQPQALTQQATP